MRFGIWFRTSTLVFWNTATFGRVPLYALLFLGAVDVKNLAVYVVWSPFCYPVLHSRGRALWEHCPSTVRALSEHTTTVLQRSLNLTSTSLQPRWIPAPTVLQPTLQRGCRIRGNSLRGSFHVDPIRMIRGYGAPHRRNDVHSRLKWALWQLAWILAQTQQLEYP